MKYKKTELINALGGNAFLDMFGWNNFNDIVDKNKNTIGFGVKIRPELSNKVIWAFSVREETHGIIDIDFVSAKGISTVENVRLRNINSTVSKHTGVKLPASLFSIH